MSARAEASLKLLAREGGNTKCANCGTIKKLGFTTVCVKYGTFVCNSCKSAHQAISHRCKSLSMSTWTESEVEALRMTGNDVARETWLANAPPVGTNGRPKEGDSIDVFKSFVIRAYEEKRYVGTPTVVEKATPMPKKERPIPKQKIAVPTPQPAIVDLLSLDNNDNDINSASTHNNNSTPVDLFATNTVMEEQAVTPIFDPFGNNNTNNTTTNPLADAFATPSSQQQQQQPALFDPFGTNTMNSNPSPIINEVPQTNQNVSFDPFGTNRNSSVTSTSQNGVTNGSSSFGEAMNKTTSNGITNGSSSFGGAMNNTKSNGTTNSVMQKKPIMNTNLGSSHFMSPHQNNVDNMKMLQQKYQEQQQQLQQQQQMMMMTMMMQQNQQNAMMMNNNNTISNNFGTSTKKTAGRDPFADLF